MELTNEMDISLLTEDELIELEFLRDQEIDLMVDENILDCNERFSIELRDGFRFEYPEMVRVAGIS